MRSLQTLGLSATLLLGGCLPFWGFVHDEVLDGPYRLVAIDTDEQMMLCMSLPSSDGCSGDGLGGARLIGAGADRRYAVMARRPADEFGELVEPVSIEYYYIIRTPDEARGLPGKLVGPMDEARFEAVKAKLDLPDFSREFEPL